MVWFRKNKIQLLILFFIVIVLVVLTQLFIGAQSVHPVGEGASCTLYPNSVACKACRSTGYYEYDEDGDLIISDDTSEENIEDVKLCAKCEKEHSKLSISERSEECKENLGFWELKYESLTRRLKAIVT